MKGKRDIVEKKAAMGKRGVAGGKDAAGGYNAAKEKSMVKKPDTGGKKGAVRKTDAAGKTGVAREKDGMGKSGIVQEQDISGKRKATGKKTFAENDKHGHMKPTKGDELCPVSRRCGGCQYLSMPYEAQLSMKQKQLESLFKKYCPVYPITGMETPYHYRNKVHAVFDHDGKGNPISGVYEANSHRVVPVESCLIEDQKADEIIGTIRGMLRSFKIKTYDEDTGYGLLRHVLVKRGFATNEIMVVLVTASPIFPSRNNFVKALREKHPEITTIIQNVNNRSTSMVLGDQEKILYGKGYIEDILCGCRFRISSKSFYQINPVQTEKLYTRAITAAGLTGKETVIDAYCGIGTIGIIASKKARQVIGVELNRDAVKDAGINARRNGIKNIRFYCNDAGKFMVGMALEGENIDVVFMDPPRSGSTVEFIESVAKLRPEKVVYISCNPETLERDLKVFLRKGFEAKGCWGIDLFPMTGHVESVVLISRK